MHALPAKPDLGQLRKHAKDLARENAVALSEAQFRLARDFGFPSWPRLVAYVRRVVDHGPDLHARDDLWHSTPEGWAEACGQPEAQALLRRLGRSGWRRFRR
ncbi:hypothetical protein [Amycolatopsis sulphurea]|uniref:hypothetical protein n=1 Tax=Amycolatopsis sulphurea TaxID=76022 RepID=UPI001FE358C2|nr:hypothetical protein [Amycolatopsis sulphurea]